MQREAPKRQKHDGAPGAVVLLSRGAPLAACPVRALERWLRALDTTRCQFQDDPRTILTKQPKSSEVAADALAVLREAFGQSIRAARLKAGLTQVDLAGKCGIGRKDISRIESGLFNLTLKTMSRVANALGQKVPDMLRGVTTPGD